MAPWGSRVRKGIWSEMDAVAKKGGVSGVFLAKLVAPALIGLVIACAPVPEGLTEEAMIYLGIFAATIMWLVLDVAGDVYISLFALCLFLVFDLADFGVVFGPFSGTTVWLVIGALGIGSVVASTGLLKRIAFAVLRMFPESYTGQVMALFSVGMVINPMIPSTTAKSAILCPFASQVSKALGYKRGSKGARGLFAAAWLSGGVLGAAFFSGAAVVFIILGFVPADQASFTWFGWLQMTCVWLIVVVAISFLFIVRCLKPGADVAAIEKGFAAKELAKMGPMTRNEKIAGIVLACALVGWMTGGVTGVDPAIVAVLAMVACALAGLMGLGDFRAGIPWGTVVFIGSILSIAGLLTTLGVASWLAETLSPVVAPIMVNPYLLVVMVCTATYLLRFVIISQTATVAVFFAVFGGLAYSMGISVAVLLFVAATSSFVWHLRFTNCVYLSALASIDEDIVGHRDNVALNFVYMGANLVACLASVPLWQSLGLL